MAVGLELCKWHIALLSTASAAAGFILSAPGIDWRLGTLVIGVFLLACGACALNHYQERKTDALMSRTKNRPIPSGRIDPTHALLFAAALIACGFSILVSTGCLAAAALGALTLFWYNGLYTRLKKKTAFAAIPGGLVGALPPAMGWTTGGGALSDPRFLALGFFLFMWQVPHFWLLLLDHAEDYRKAGFPVLTDLFSRKQLARLTAHWTFAAAVSALLIPLYGLASSPAVIIALVMSSFWFGSQGITLVRAKEPGYCAAFKKTGSYLLLVMVILTLERFAFLSTCP